MAPIIGPPAIRSAIAPAPSSSDVAPAPSPSSTGDQFIDLLSAHYNSPDSSVTGSPPMGYTENFSRTYLSSGDPCLDFFFHVVPDTPSSRLLELLKSAWDRDPLTALKLVCHLRDVRGTGKSDKESFHTAALWIHNNHPKTLALNIKHIAAFGYLKDMPEILFRLHQGGDFRKIAKKKREMRELGLLVKKMKPSPSKGRSRGQKSKSTVEKMLATERSVTKNAPEMVRERRKKRETEQAKRALERYNRDLNYQFLHDQISDCFAQLLRSDVASLKAGKLRQIGLAAKWCPSLDSSYDRHTLLCESIARRVFPRDSDPEYSALEEAHYAYRIRDRLRKDVLVPLRAALDLPEVYMSANKWDSLPYARVPSVAMKNYKELFEKHDAERFGEYLGKVKAGTAKIAAGALLPHEILANAGSEVADLQWKRLVSDVAEKGRLNNCIAVCDVSGSMMGTPMDVCIALGILVSELSEEPWKGKVITFSENPQLHIIQGETLQEKMNFVKMMDWGMNTNFQKVFDKILGVAIQGNLPPEKMIKRVFVFSDMEFDSASANPWETDYEAIKRKFLKSGYGAPPEIVFWNLRSSRSTPVPMEEKGVALVSGFSKNLLKLFLDEARAMSPAEVMRDAISGDEYAGLVIFD